MRHNQSEPQAGQATDPRAEAWHRLTLDAGGHITSGYKDIARLLGPPAAALVGKPVTVVLPDLPFSDKTPGYNLAYAIFHGANGNRIRRKARAADGHSISVDTVLSSCAVKGQHRITLDFREARAA